MYEEIHKNQQILFQIQQFIQEWKELKPEDIIIQKLTGITNITSKVEIKNQQNINVNPKILIHRHFGKGAGGLIIRELENFIFSYLYQNRIGPSCLGLTNQFRLEEFIQMDHPSPQIFGSDEFQMMLTFLLSMSIHKLQPVHQLLSNSPLCYNILQQNSTLVLQFNNFLQQAIKEQNGKNIFRENIQIMSSYAKIVNSEKERNFLLQELKNVYNEQNDNVFSHNDILQFNVFIEKSKENKIINIKLIDFEYACYNLRGFDIADFLMEDTFDYSIKTQPFFAIQKQKFPSQDKIKQLCMFYIYLQNTYNNSQPTSFNNCLNDYDICYQEFVKFQQNKNGFEEFNVQAHKLQRQVNYCLILANYYWGVWAILQASFELEFDYFEYAKERLDCYNFFLQLYKQLYKLE